MTPTDRAVAEELRTQIAEYDEKLVRLQAGRTALVVALAALERQESASRGPGDTRAALTLLAHPERVEGALRLRGKNATWVRQDGKPWECDCGKKSRTLAHLASHLRNVVNPDRHRPLIEERSSEVAQAGPGEAVEAERRQDQAVPCNTAPPTNRPFACSCGERFTSAHEWSEHRRSQGLVTSQAKHRLIEQPPARWVPTGVPVRHGDLDAARLRAWEHIG